MTTIRRSGLTRTNTPFEYTPDKIQNTCKNVNITNVLNPSFHGTKKGTTADIIRPEFKQGISSLKIPISTADIRNNRSGLGNNLILRPNFAAPSVPPRQVVDYLLQAKLQAQQGMKVTLGDETLKKLFEITTVDPTDVGWIAEYKRRKALGDSDEFLAISPPLGRPQRVMKKTVNFAEATNLATKSSLTISESLEALKTLITTGIGSAGPIALLAKTMELSESLATFSEDNLRTFGIILDKIGVPEEPDKFFGPAEYHRFWSANQVRDNLARVATFLSANVNANPRFPTIDSVLCYYSVKDDAPKDWKTLQKELSTGGGVTRGIELVYTAEGDVAPRPDYIGYRYFLDLTTRSTVTRDYVIAQVNTGVDNGQIDGKFAPPLRDGSVGLWLDDADTAIFASRGISV